MKLKDIILEGVTSQEVVYNRLLQFFKEQKKGGGPRFEHAYEIWKDYKSYILMEMVRATQEGENSLNETPYTPTNIELVYLTSGEFNKCYVYNSSSDYDFVTLDSLRASQEYLKKLSGLSIKLPEKYDEVKLKRVSLQMKKRGIKLGYGDYMNIDTSTQSLQ